MVTHSDTPHRYLTTVLHRSARAVRALGFAGLAAGLLLSGAPTAAAVPATPSGLPTAVDGVPQYVGAAICSPTVKPGTAALMRLLLGAYPSSRALGIVRACGVGGKSEHKEGRALDWGNRAWVGSEAANVASFSRWALATDAHGNRNAMARRLGIMYMIWDDRIWEASNASAGWQPYLHSACSSLAGCPASLRHRDHLHISLTWDGAMGRTSFWSGQVATNGSGAGSVRGSRAPSLTLGVAAVARNKASIRQVNHTVLQHGSSGGAVVVLQKALRMRTVTGYFGDRTRATVLIYQRSRGLPTTGVVARLTWGRLNHEISIDSRRIAHTRRSVISPGASGRYVQVLESALNIPVDGRYTRRDVQAVRYFQRVHRIRPTGVVARLTWRALRSV